MSAREEMTERKGVLCFKISHFSSAALNVFNFA